MRTNSVLLLAAPAVLAVSACASPKDDDGVDSASDSAADTAIDTGEDTDSGDTGADSGDSGADSGDTDDGACNTTAMYAGCSGTVDYDFYGGTATGTMTWDADGNLLLNERIDDATGEVVRVESTYTDGRLATQVTTRNGAALADWTYTYDAAGTLIEATDAAQNLTNFYSYDADGHLVERGTDYFNDGTVDYRCTLTWTDGADGATSSFETCDNGSTISTDYDARGLVSRTEYSYSGYTVEQTNVWRDDCQLASASFVDSTTRRTRHDRIPADRGCSRSTRRRRCARRHPDDRQRRVPALHAARGAHVTVPVAAPLRVLLVDDSPIVRMAYRMLLEGDPRFVVVGEAGDPYEARERILADNPDVITLDVEMPRMDGISFLRRLMQFRPTPVVVISSVAGRGSAMAVEALHIGAAEVVDKPATALARQRFGPTLTAALLAATQTRTQPRTGGPAAVLTGPAEAALVAIGASTGGPAQLLEVLPRLPRDLPPVVIVQHMPEGFTAAFADRLARASGHDVREATSGEVLRPGMFRVAPGGRHLVVAGTARSVRTTVQEGPMINFHRPSVDLFFQTAARVCGPAAVGVLLTGMGEDGARGLLTMRQAGARTLGQDEASNIVYGMPKAGWEIGAVARQVGIAQLPGAIVDAVRSA